MAQIHWASALSADFSVGGDWIGGTAPGAADDAILDPAGSPFTVTVSTTTTVASIQAAANATLSINNATMTAAAGSGSGANAGLISIGDGSTLQLGGAVDNSGTILLDSIGDSTNLEILSGDNLTLSGGGVVRLSDNGANTLDAEAPGATLINVDNKIVGVGQLGSANLTIDNEAGAKIKANGALPLVIEAKAITNDGIIQVAMGDNLILGNTTVTNGAAGLIKAKDGAQISLQSADIIGGTLATLGAGVIQTTDTGSQLDGSTTAVTNSGALQIGDNTALTILGSIDNTGTITLDANLGGVSLTIGGATTLAGGGDITLSDSSGNAVGGASGVALVNVDNTISGAGALGQGELVITNQTAGVIDATGAVNALVINTGANAVTNDGLIEATGAGGAKIKSAVVNNGTLEANGGALTFKGAITGTGQAVIAAGSIVFKSGFNQNVTFTGATGSLKLVDSQAYTGTITGFSLTGGTRLDLKDIGFVSAGEATFVGTASGGTLTVTDGIHTAHIALSGNYTGSSFIASSDGAGGVSIVDPPASNPSSSLFAQAMAGLAGVTTGAPQSLIPFRQTSEPILSMAHQA